MSLMKAVQVSHAGGAFELVERPRPSPGEGQVRILETGIRPLVGTCPCPSKMPKISS